MRIAWSLFSAIAVLALVAIARRRHARLNGPTLVPDLAAWDKAMPLPKPIQKYTGTQPVDRKALAKALKGTKPRAKTRRLTLVPHEDIRRLG